MKEQKTELLAAEVQLKYKSRIPASKRVQVKCSMNAFRVFWEHWDKDTIEHCEEFKTLMLNSKNVALGITDISKGGITSTLTDIRIVFQYALKTHAVGIIVAHNHPGNNPTPSESDMEITRKLTEAGKLLNIIVLDHIVLCPDGSYYSFGDEGRI